MAETNHDLEDSNSFSKREMMTNPEVNPRCFNIPEPSNKIFRLKARLKMYSFTSKSRIQDFRCGF